MIIKIKGIAKNILMSPWPYRILRFSLAALFIYGGVMKLFDPKSFARVISSYDIVPEILLPFIAIGLPLLETVAGIALLFDIQGSLAVISGLLGLFLFVLGYGILSDLNVDCGCFGAGELAQQDSLRQAFYRDLFLVGIIVPYLYMSRWVRNRAVLTVQEQTGKNKGEKNP
jgi:uncharacterized membrane protein YphA (DoxX/SURF4 family)